MEFSQKLKIYLSCYLEISLLRISKKKKMKTPNSKRYIHPNVHNSIIYNSQNMDTT